MKSAVLKSGSGDTFFCEISGQLVEVRFSPAYVQEKSPKSGDSFSKEELQGLIKDGSIVTFQKAGSGPSRSSSQARSKDASGFRDYFAGDRSLPVNLEKIWDKRYLEREDDPFSPTPTKPFYKDPFGDTFQLSVIGPLPVYDRDGLKAWAAKGRYAQAGVKKPIRSPSVPLVILADPQITFHAGHDPFNVPVGVTHFPGGKYVSKPVPRTGADAERYSAAVEAFKDQYGIRAISDDGFDLDIWKSARPPRSSSGPSAPRFDSIEERDQYYEDNYEELEKGLKVGIGVTEQGYPEYYTVYVEPGHPPVTKYAGEVFPPIPVDENGWFIAPKKKKAAKPAPISHKKYPYYEGNPSLPIVHPVPFTFRAVKAHSSDGKSGAVGVYGYLEGGEEVLANIPIWYVKSADDGKPMQKGKVYTIDRNWLDTNEEAFLTIADNPDLADQFRARYASETLQPVSVTVLRDAPYAHNPFHTALIVRDKSGRMWQAEVPLADLEEHPKPGTPITIDRKYLLPVSPEARDMVKPPPSASKSRADFVNRALDTGGFDPDDVLSGVKGRLALDKLSKRP